LCGQVTGVWFRLYLSSLYVTCRDDDAAAADDDDKLLFVSLSPVFMCVVTEQPSGQLQNTQYKVQGDNIKEKRREKKK